MKELIQEVEGPETKHTDSIKFFRKKVLKGIYTKDLASLTLFLKLLR